MDGHHPTQQSKDWNSPYIAQSYVQDYPLVGPGGNNLYPPAAHQEPNSINPFTSSSVPQNVPPPVVYQNLANAAKRRRTFWSWTWELLSLLLCIGLIAAIFVVLAAYNGQRVPDWGLSINLSTLVALLATILRASLVMIAAQVISQAKWSWFSSNGQVHPLSQLQVFDAASRGAVGAASLIPTVLVRSPVALIAAVITIVSFATGPFVQQAIKTVGCDEIVPGERASVPIAHYAPGSSGYFTLGAGRLELTNDMKGALIAGLSNPLTVDTNIAASCKTGNCTFADYASIGLCSYCKDITSLVTGPHELNGTRFGEFRLPNGAGVSPETNKAILTVDATTNMSWIPDFPSDYAWAIHNFTVLVGKDKPSGDRCKDTRNGNIPNCDYTASACALYPCMRIYSANVSAGAFSEDPVSSVPVVPDLRSNNGTSAPNPYRGFETGREMVAIETPCRLNNGQIYTASNISLAPDAVPVIHYPPPSFTRVETAAPISCQHRFYEGYAIALRIFFFEQLLNGGCVYDFGKTAGVPICNDTFWLEAFFHNWTATPKKIASAVETLALAGTNKLRVTGKTASVDNNAISESGTFGDKTEGDVWTTMVCTEVDWRWLLLPAVLVGLTVVALVMAIINSWHGPVWKASILPMVFYGGGFVTRDGEPVRSQGESTVMTAEEMEKLAGKVDVRLDVNGASQAEKITGLQPGRNENVEVDSLLMREADRSPGIRT